MNANALKDELDRTLFLHPGDHERRRMIFFALLAAIYYMGFYLWTNFFNLGILHFTNSDWAEKYRALHLLSEAMEQGVIPYHSTVPLSIWHLQLRFLAMPHTILSPQVFLLQKLDVGPFILFNMRLFYTLGFIGLLALGHRFRLSAAATFILFILFNFNGYVVSHLGIGHSEWFAYFLFPYFILFVFHILETDTIVLPSMALAILLFIIILQGAFHFALWIMLFLALMWVFKPSKRLAWILLSTSVQTLLLSAARVGPAMMVFGTDQLDYVPGYDSLATLFIAFTVIRDLSFPPIMGLFAQHPINWWEYDMYTSGFGLFFLLYFGIYRRLLKDRFAGANAYRDLDWPMLILFLLTLGHVYFTLFYETRFPVIGNAERAPTRFIIMPVLFLIVLSCIWYQRFLNASAGNMNARIRMASGLGILAATYLLLIHFRLWSVAHIDQSGIMPPPLFPGDFGPTIFKDDLLYIRVVNISYAISAASLAVWAIFLVFFLMRRKPKRKIGPAHSQLAQTA